MYGKTALSAILIILLSLIQVSFVSGLPGWFNNINAAALALVFVLALGSFRLALFWAFGLGFFMDIYSFLPFGVYLATFLATVIIMNFFLVNFFTNRSLYSFLALTLLCLLVHEIFVYALSRAIYLLGHRDFIIYLDAEFWANQPALIGVNLAAVFVVFYFLTFVSKNLRPVFLIRRKQN